MKNFHVIDSCRISGTKDLINILNLGNQPLANSLKKEIDEMEQKFPLSISFSKKSSLIQLNETVNKEILFDRYVWVTGTSKTASNFSKLFADRLINIIKPDKNDLIIEIASNDGTFMMPFFEKGYNNIFGVDPAKNIAKIANKMSLNTLPEYWNSELSKFILKKYGTAKIIFARNVIPHVSDLLDVIKGIHIALDNKGVGVIEFHYSGKILKELQYDSIYHEHLCYFSIKSISYLLESFGLNPFHVEESPISGGALIIFFSKLKKVKTVYLKNAIKKESNLKVNDVLNWKNFANDVLEHKKRTIDIINTVKGKTIIGFGSSARSQTYLNYCELNSNHIVSIIDNNPNKIGLFAPGSSIPIVSFEQGMKIKPDIIFILAWNFKNEIINECKKYGFKGKYLIAFPKKLYLSD